MDNKVQNKLNELIKNYSKNLPNKIVKIEELWKKQQSHWDLGQFQEFHREVHSLCGSAGTYGYPELCKTAREMEIFLKTILNNEMISNQDKESIADYLIELSLIASRDTPKNVSISPIENKCIYLLEQDNALSQQLSDSLKQIDFSPYLIQDMLTLQHAVKEKPPVAIIIDTEYLDKSGIQLLHDLQKEQPALIQLFCIIPNSELIPRLAAIRAGGQAFFQKPVDIPQLTHLVNLKCSISSDDPHRILIIDDSESLAQYYALILNQAGMNAKAITNPLLLLKELESFQPNLLLMDVYMPDCTGFELAAVLRQEAIYTKIPIIFLSTEEDKDKKLFAISLGGDDFLTKPVPPQHLISAVRSRLKRASILNYYMTTDSLTGLLNHASILKQLEVHLKQAKRLNLPLSFVMIDIDHFKKINDEYGHPVGDEVIKKISTLFLSRLRSQDLVGRYGGEEFVLILPGSSLENATKIANDLRIQFSRYNFKIEGVDFFVTFSAGISGFNDLNSASEIVKQADDALYQAKLRGRNQVVSFN